MTGCAATVGNGCVATVACYVTSVTGIPRTVVVVAGLLAVVDGDVVVWYCRRRDAGCFVSWAGRLCELVWTASRREA